jgi:phosphatidylglycerol:prolipoprotein diacylglycerol transferase
MPSPVTEIGPWTVRTYTLFLALGIGVSAGIGIYRSRKVGRVGALVDCCLAGLVAGVLVARLVHVLLNWDYFAYNVAEAYQVNAGGLDWHGAVVGGVIGLQVMARWRHVNAHDLLDALAPGLPLIAQAGWYGCWAAGCAYGAEVDTLARYPSYAVSESADVFGIAAPRYNTQIFGQWLAIALLVVTLILLWRGWLRESRFWLVLALLSACMFVIGFWRGDHAIIVNGLRLDQWLDVEVGLSALTVSILRSGLWKRSAQAMG